MTHLSPFIVLLDRRRWRAALAGALAALALLAASSGLRSAHAASAPADKIAADLQAVLGAAKTAKLSWAKDDKGIRYVKVLVIADSSDPTLAGLRADVLARGGSVYMRYLSVNALSVMLPASAVGAIAARSDVQGISPNRLTARTASTLEVITGTLTPDVRTYSNPQKYSGLDGTGVGIAVLDSGIEKYHSNLLAADGVSFRVKAAVDFQKVGDAAAVGAKDRAVGTMRQPRWHRAVRPWPTTSQRSTPSATTVLTTTATAAMWHRSPPGVASTRPKTRPASRPMPICMT